MKLHVNLFLIALVLLIPVIICAQTQDEQNAEFLYFEATETNGRIYLKWDTYNDITYENLILQRSSNGQVWYNIDHQKPKGDYHQNSSYYFIDTSAPNGMSYYRVSMVKRGKPAIRSMVNVVKINPRGVVRCFPNPTTGVVNFYIESSEHTRGYLRLVNGQGFIEHDEIIEVEEGVSAFKRDFSQLEAGLYIIKLDFDTGLSFSQQEFIQH